jgi:hypothetical protein
MQRARRDAEKFTDPVQDAKYLFEFIPIRV